MINEVVRAFFSLVKSPALLVVSLFAVLVNTVAGFAMADSLSRVILGLFSGDLAVSTASDVVWLGLSGFGFELAVVLLLSFVLVLIASGLGFVFGRFAVFQEEKKPRVIAALEFGLSNWKKLVAWSFFVLVIGLALWALFLLVGGIAVWNSIVGLVLFLVWVALSIIIVFSVSLNASVMGAEALNGREALKKTANVIKQFWKGFVWLLIGLVIVLGVLGFVGNALADSAAYDEDLELAVVVLFWMVEISIANLAIAFFYLNHRKKAEGIESLK